MLHKGLDFHIVRVVCHSCGWHRVIAHSGCADGKRAIIKIEGAKDISHVLQAKIIEIPEEQPKSEWKENHPDFRDLVEEAHEFGLYKTMDKFDDLLQDKKCPRCKKNGNIKLEQQWNLGEHANY